MTEISVVVTGPEEAYDSALPPNSSCRQGRSRSPAPATSRRRRPPAALV